MPDMDAIRFSAMKGIERASGTLEILDRHLDLLETSRLDDAENQKIDEAMALINAARDLLDALVESMREE
jgi:hypothetical protein